MLKYAEKFFKIFTNLPDEERKNPIVIIEDKPVSWNVAYDHINNETKKGEEILNILNKIGLI
ncbi:MAG: hypothetical protein KAQ83_03860 [Nanoarchaeota archaeon]|nr:hypothetical protein [Nanoarchaeota archaeon]